MITILTNVIPIALGFLAKLIALKSQASSDNQKLLLEAFAAKNDALNSLRDRADKESPWSALNRRLLLLIVMGLIVFIQVGPTALGVDTVIPTIKEGFSFMGIQLTQDIVTYETVTGLVKYQEVFTWATMIIEFAFGASLAKAK